MNTHLVIRSGRGFSMRLHRRALIMAGLLSALCMAWVFLTISSGDYGLTPISVLSVLLGGGDETTRMIVLEWRLPRAVLAVLIGAALGLSGSIFQSLTRNPLGSPDIMGFSAGAYTGALIVMLKFAGGYAETAAGSLCGGLATAIVVYGLAWRQGVDSFRLIIVGIGIAAMLTAVNAWLMSTAGLDVAMAAAVWGAGSLNAANIQQVGAVAVVLTVLLPVLVLLSRASRQLDLGDELAHASGVAAQRVRLILMTIGVCLVASATAAVGPIAFIALCAPQIARKLWRSAGIPLVGSALTGSLVLLVSDWLARHAFPMPVPTGVVTVSLGGLYFVWLLIQEGRR